MRSNKHHFAAAAAEVEKKKIDAGLWAKATAESHGDKTVTHARYLQLRAEELSRKDLNEGAMKILHESKNQFDKLLSYLGDIFLVTTVFFLLIMGVLVGIASQTNTEIKLFLDSYGWLMFCSPVAAVIHRVFIERKH